MHYLINAVLIYCHCMASEDHCKVLSFCQILNTCFFCLIVFEGGELLFYFAQIQIINSKMNFLKLYGLNDFGFV